MTVSAVWNVGIPESRTHPLQNTSNNTFLFREIFGLVQGYIAYIKYTKVNTRPEIQVYSLMKTKCPLETWCVFFV